jgi:hypothetical protein
MSEAPMSWELIDDEDETASEAEAEDWQDREPDEGEREEGLKGRQG